MTFEEIERLVRRLEGSDITEMTVTDDASSLTLAAWRPARPNEPPASPRSSPPRRPRPKIQPCGPGRSACCGLRHPEAADAPVFPRAVTKGDIVAFLQAGPLLLPVVAEADGSIGEPLVTDGGLIGYGTPPLPPCL